MLWIVTGTPYFFTLLRLGISVFDLDTPDLINPYFLFRGEGLAGKEVAAWFGQSTRF
jgi:hypothetical protein